MSRRRAEPARVKDVSTETIEGVFSVLAVKGDQVGKEHLIDAIRACGKAPTQADIQRILDKVKGDTFDLNTLKTIVRDSSVPLPAALEEDMTNCFRALDREDNGTVHEAEFRQLLSTLGDSLHASEVAEILREVPINRDGYIDYQKVSFPCPSSFRFLVISPLFPPYLQEFLFRRF